MATFFSGWWSEFSFVILSVLFVYYVYFKVVGSQYWRKRNVFHLEPVFLLGNTWHASFTENFFFVLSGIYREWKDKKIVGFWNFTTPTLLINDLDIVKNVLTRDFSYFRDRGFPIDFHNDPLAENLFNVGGAKWRNLRVKLTPTFTSGKMKMMFPTMVKCGEELQEQLRNLAESKEQVEVKEILSRFTTDIISSCAFGIQTNSLKNPDSEFRQYGKKIFEPTLRSLVSGILLNVSPLLAKILKTRFTPKDVTEFFLSAVRDTMECREKNKIKRNDFLELLIQLKNKGKLEDVDGVIPTSPDGEPEAVEDIKFTFKEAAAQAFVFFAAGFETSSTALSFALYELALNPEIQSTLQKEIDDALEKNQSKVTYESLHDMQYLDCVVQGTLPQRPEKQNDFDGPEAFSSPKKFPHDDSVQSTHANNEDFLKIIEEIETLRKYPPVPFLFRQCNKDYEIPELNVVIPKKTTVMIPVYGIQTDAQNFPEPDKFDPLRFSLEEKEKRHSCAFLPFGEGPRNCIGNRFGLMQTKVGLVSILSKLTVKVARDTPIPLKYDKRSFVLSSESGIPLKFVTRI